MIEELDGVIVGTAIRRVPGCQTVMQRIMNVELVGRNANVADVGSNVVLVLLSMRQ